MTNAVVRDRGLNLLTGRQNAQENRNRAGVQQHCIDDTVWRRQMKVISNAMWMMRSSKKETGLV